MQQMLNELTAMGTLCEQAIASAVNGLLKPTPPCPGRRLNWTMR